VKKRLEAQTTAQIQDDVTNNFTIHKKTSGIVWDAFDTGRLELRRRRTRRKEGRKEA
jgi:hypothetical protein